MEEVGRSSPWSATSKSGLLRNPLAVGVLATILVLYLFYASVGTWNDGPASTEYYAMLADSFRQGKTYLAPVPAEELGALADPYEPSSRVGIPILADAAYYQGRYYIYWGPVPAIFLAIAKTVIPGGVPDNLVGLCGQSLAFLFASLAVLWLWRRTSTNLPWWLLAGSLLVVGLSYPILPVLSTGEVHEAAIASGQAFLMLGVLVALPVLFGESASIRRLVVVGVVWGLALGSRVSLAGAVAGGTGLLLLAVARRAIRPRRSSSVIYSSLAIGMPLLLAIGLLAAYNSIRFDDPFETGLRYQLSGLNNRYLLRVGLLFSPRYLAPDTFYYLVLPPVRQEGFPYLAPAPEKPSSFVQFLERFGVPASHRLEQVTGLVFAFPFLVFAVTAAGRCLCSQEIRDPDSETIVSSEPPRSRAGFRRATCFLVLLGVLALAPSFFYFWVTYRFLLDGIMPLALAASVGSWQTYAAVAHRPVKKAVVRTLIAGALLASALVGLAMGFSGRLHRFEEWNPVILTQLDQLIR